MYKILSFLLCFLFVNFHTQAEEYIQLKESVYFLTPALELPASADTVIQKLAALLNQYPDMKISLLGYTDTAAISPKTISHLFALLVKRQLSLYVQGSMDRVETRSMGSSTEFKERLRNNRVECYIVLPSVAPPEKVSFDSIFVFNNIYFKKDSWELDQNAFDELDNLANILIVNPNLVLEVAGFASAESGSSSSSSYNIWISNKRANVVRDYLIQKGVQLKQLETKGYGDHILVSPRDDENRRVEFKILSK